MTSIDQLTQARDQAKARLLQAYDELARGLISSVGYCEQAYIVAGKRLAAAQLKSEASQIAAAILGPGNE